MNKRIKLLLMIPHLGGGGAERVIALLARYLNPEHFEIHLCLITKENYGDQPIPRWVQVHRLKRTRVRHAWYRIVRLIRTEQPDVVLSGMAHLNFLILLLKPLLLPRIRIVVRQNTTASAAPTRLARFLYRHLYPHAHAIICQSKPMADDLAVNFGIADSKLAVLANPVVLNPVRADVLRTAMPDSLTDPWPRLLAVSRLAHEKGLDLLLRAIPEIQQQYPRLRLKIFGTGPEEAALKALAAELSIEAVVTFAGYSNYLAAAYAEATLFILPSLYEGLPNALLEAAAAGLPLVATPCSNGVIELFQNAPGAWLASGISADSLAQAILAAIVTLPHPSARFSHAFLAPFEANTAIAAYAAFLESAAPLASR